MLRLLPFPAVRSAQINPHMHSSISTTTRVIHVSPSLCLVSGAHVSDRFFALSISGAADRVPGDLLSDRGLCVRGRAGGRRFGSMPGAVPTAHQAGPDADAGDDHAGKRRLVVYVNC